MAKPTPSYANPLMAALQVVVFDNGTGTPIVVDASNPLPVTLQSATVSITGPVTMSSEVEVKNDSGNPIPVSGSAAVGSAPTAPPLSVSGVDGSGNKQHIKVDTSGNVGMYGAAVRTASTATISNGTSVSAAVDLLATSIVGFIMPAAWTAAALNIEVSADNSTWATAVYDGSGLAVSSWSSPVAAAAYAVDALSMMPFRYVRFRSGTSGTPVNQGADRAITVITRPLA